MAAETTRISVLDFLVTNRTDYYSYLECWTLLMIRLRTSQSLFTNVSWPNTSSFNVVSTLNTSFVSKYSCTIKHNTNSMYCMKNLSENTRSRWHLINHACVPFLNLPSRKVNDKYKHTILSSKSDVFVHKIRWSHCMSPCLNQKHNFRSKQNTYLPLNIPWHQVTCGLSLIPVKVVQYGYDLSLRCPRRDWSCERPLGHMVWRAMGLQDGLGLGERCGLGGETDPW